MIDILIPVLGRPHRAAPLVQNIQDTTTEEHQIIFVCSEDDEKQFDACKATDAKVFVIPGPAGPGDYARKINRAEVMSGDMTLIGEHGIGPTIPGSEWIFMGADDLTFEPRWDTHALRAANSGAGYDVVGTNDLANAQVRRGQFGTHCLIRRRYVTEKGGTADGGPGTVLHEGYDHNFVDRELCHVAQHRGVFAFARHSHVKHSHPLWRTAPDDPTYRKALRHFRQDQRLFLSRAHLWNHVGLSAPERKMAA